MTEKKKEKNSNYKNIQGYLKTYEYREAWGKMWNKITNEEKEIIMNIPNFDNSKFYDITGIKL